jgi:Protein of unknown function (DUF4238)
VSTPRKHHFIPAFFLKQWAAADGKLVEYSIKNDKIVSKRVGPKSAGFEYDLYAFPELPPETAQFIEQQFFSYADQTASQALELHLVNADRSAWTVELISAWSRFVIALQASGKEAGRNRSVSTRKCANPETPQRSTNTSPSAMR